MVYILFLILSFISSSGFSKDTPFNCKTIDESRSPYLGPMDDQGNYNTCYAFVGSYLLGHHLGLEINPEHVAVRNEYYNDQNKSSTVEEMMREGIGQVAHAVNSQMDYGFLTECGNNEIAKRDTHLDPLSYLAQLEKNCSLFKISDQKKLKIVRNSVETVGKDTVLYHIDSLLDKNKISAVFGTPRFFKGFEAEDGNWFHVMTIVGRRFNFQTESCEYIMRNTRGPDVNKNIKIHGPYNYRYEKGHYIVSRSYLRDYMSGIYFVKE